MKTHSLKCWPTSFNAILDGEKRFDVRAHDRKFKVGQLIVLRMWLPRFPDKTVGDFVDREGVACEKEDSMSQVVRITSMENGVETEGIVPGYVVLGYEPGPMNCADDPRRPSPAEFFG